MSQQPNQSQKAFAQLRQLQQADAENLKNSKFNYSPLDYNEELKENNISPVLSLTVEHCRNDGILDITGFTLQKIVFIYNPFDIKVSANGLLKQIDQ